MPLRPLRVASVAVTLVLAAGLGACGSDEPSKETSSPATQPVANRDEPATRLDVIALDHSFTTTATMPIAAGVVPVRLENRGKEPHQVMIGRLHDGLTIDDVMHADNATVEAKLTWVGGANIIDPGGTVSAYADLAPGTYALVCFVPSPDGENHLHKGMVREMQVVATDAPAAAPPAIADVTLRDFALALPEGGLAKAGTYRFVNEGAEPHEMVIMRMKDGKSLGDAATFLQSGFKGEPPFTFAGGPGVIAPGTSGYADLDLEPGSYVAMCFVTGAHTGQPHAAMGMVSAFEIS